MRKIKLFEEFEVEPRKEQEFPCTFTIITDKSDRNTNQPRSIKNDGYHILIDTPEELEKYEKDFPLNGYYNGEKIISTHINSADYGSF